MRGVRHVGGLLAVALAAAPASAQSYDVPSGSQVPPAWRGPILIRVDQAVGDRDPLAVSFRDQQADLAVPTGFREVYRIAGRDDLYLRQAGAVRAVFRRSTYVSYEGRELAEVPPGTVFSIGFPRSLSHLASTPVMGQPNAVVDAAMRVDRRLDLRAESSASPAGSLMHESAGPLDLRAHVQAPHDAVSGGQPDGTLGVFSVPMELPERLPRFLSDEAYRRHRVQALLAAARGEPVSDPRP